MTDEKEKDFAVKDSRLFDSSGNPVKSETSESETDTNKTVSESEPSTNDVPNQEINFVSFVLSLSTSAMMHLGLTENPLTKSKEEDIVLARQEIQLIEMLKEKTQGNLTDEEARMVEDVLFHLRMKYVEKAKQ